MRLDQLLVLRDLAPSRQRARELILQEQVLVEGRINKKPGAQVNSNAIIAIQGAGLAYPSRAGLKLEKALQVFQIDVQGLSVLDVGASTGGFTSCLLQAGAKLVIAVDVGQGQLVAELRDDPRVLVFEKTNIRDLTLSQLPAPVDLATVDVSFISLTKVMPTVRSLLTDCGQIVALVKPQFETEGAGLSKRGVISKQRVHLTYLPPLINQLQGGTFGLTGFDFSPINGGKGNLEYLAHFQAGAEAFDASELVCRVIRTGWNERKGEGSGGS